MSGSSLHAENDSVGPGISFRPATKPHVALCQSELRHSGLRDAGLRQAGSRDAGLRQSGSRQARVRIRRHSLLLAIVWLGACLMLASGGERCVHAEDWPGFRGPGGLAASRETGLPQTWSSRENLVWRVALPGAGSSSPIVVGDRVFVTSYSGYGVPEGTAGTAAGPATSDIARLERQLTCFELSTGKQLWTRSVKAQGPEDAYQGFITEHGYASGTPVADGERVYAFFGKAGVHAFDWDGKPLWSADVGKESSNRRWGTGSSLVLHQETLIVNASEESQSIRGFDRRSGKEIWKASAAALELAYGTPTLTSVAGQTEVAIAVPGEVWGLNPETGKLKWFAEHGLTGNISPSVVADGETLYIFGGFRAAGSLSVRAGGNGDVTRSHLGWTGRNSSYVATPVLVDGHLYWIDDRGQAYCVAAKTGELVYRERVEGLTASGRPVYASPIAADGRLYIPSRWHGVLVLAAKPSYQLLARNQFDGDESDFNGSVAISGGRILLRSDRYLYCVGQTAK